MAGRSREPSPTTRHAGHKKPKVHHSDATNVLTLDDSGKRCMTCNVVSPAEEMMKCCCCANSFHPRCANLPDTPDGGEFYCRYTCYANFHRSQDLARKGRNGVDYMKLATLIHAVIQQKALRQQQKQQKPQQLPVREHRDGRVSEVTERTRPHQHEDSSRYRVSPDNGNGSGEHGLSIRNSEAGIDRQQEWRRSDRQVRSSSSLSPSHEYHRPPPPYSPPAPSTARTKRRSASRERSAGEYDGVDIEKRQKPHDSVPMLDSEPTNASHVFSNESQYGTFPAPPLRRHGASPGHTAASFPIDSSPYNQMRKETTSGRGFVPLTQLFDHRGASSSDSIPLPPHRLPTLPQVSMRTEGDARGAMNGIKSIYDGPHRKNSPFPPTSAQASSTFHPQFETVSSKAHPEYNGMALRARSNGHLIGTGALADNGTVPSSQPQSEESAFLRDANLPWLNSAAFPTEIYERFACEADNANHLFRIDLTPAFVAKSTRLNQPEIDFFFRCFETAEVSLVVKGMASDLNQYIWAWPFILENCGSECDFVFDHFQYKRHPDNGDLVDLEYVGELTLSIASYSAYVEKFLCATPGKDVVVLEDHASKKQMALVAGENMIVLNNLVLANHCTQLYSDFIKRFQWDVFASGIHCLLQYLPQNCMLKRFCSPLLHFNFPGARGQLSDPGNGTTDTAYQVLVGSMELIIFERLEPHAKDEFYRILSRFGYDVEKRTMLLDSHLRALRSSGFAWSTVTLTEGEFIHVNKGRMHIWRILSHGPVANAPCVFLSWEWVYQGVSQRGISTECWFAMKSANLAPHGWAFDPKRAIVEAAKCGVAIIHTGQFLNTTIGGSTGMPNTVQLLAFSNTSSVNRDVIMQRQDQMVLFLESILPCLNAIVDEECELSRATDDCEEFRSLLDEELLWTRVDTAAGDPSSLPTQSEYMCAICGLELTNIYKQCLGCTLYARRCRRNMTYTVFRICLRCHAQPEHHHFKPRQLSTISTSVHDSRILSSQGHTGLLPATRRYQSDRSYFKCRCTPSIRCAFCDGCESCCCLCHTLFQTRFRFSTPATNFTAMVCFVSPTETLHQLRLDVKEVIERRKQPSQH